MNRYVLRLEALFAFAVPAMILVLTGLGFLIAALYIGLARDMAPAGAALTTGAVCLAGAGLLTLIGWLVLRSLAARGERDEKAPAAAAPDAVKMAMAVGEALGGDLQSLAKNHRYGLIGAALAAGFAVGVSPKLRRSLLNLLDD